MTPALFGVALDLPHKSVGLPHTCGQVSCRTAEKYQKHEEAENAGPRCRKMCFAELSEEPIVRQLDGFDGPPRPPQLRAAFRNAGSASQRGDE